MKPYRTIAISECGEPLVPIPREIFAFFEPHAYVALGAPYRAGESPWMVRQGTLQALLEAQKRLTSLCPGWKIMVFDGYRPNAVQEFMVHRAFRLEAEAANLNLNTLTEADQEVLAKKVFRIWGQPSDNPATPPPHSTGGAIDCSLADATGAEVFMGSPIDENSERSNPDYFAGIDERAHQNRELLRQIMTGQGFVRHHAEWWHFSLCDQYWAWVQREADPANQIIARYGRADLL